MNIQIHKINDECLSQTKYNIYIEKTLYVGNIKKSGLKFWKDWMYKKYNWLEKIKKDLYKCHNCKQDFEENDYVRNNNLCRGCDNYQEQLNRDTIW